MKAVQSKVMRAMQVSKVQAGAAEFVAAEIPQPKPSAGEVLIRVHAAGVTATELIWSTTTQTKDGAPRANAIPAHEFSGVIAEVGSDVHDFRIGQEIYGVNDWFADGALAEYCVTTPPEIAPKPEKITHAEAA